MNDRSERNLIDLLLKRTEIETCDAGEVSIKFKKVVY